MGKSNKNSNTNVNQGFSEESSSNEIEFLRSEILSDCDEVGSHMTESDMEEIRKNIDPLGCAYFITSTPYPTFVKELAERVIGQDEQIKRLAFDIYQYIKDVASTVPCFPKRMCDMIAGKSGCGKTEFCRAVEEVLKTHGCSIPVIKIDVTTLTQSGYQGAEVSDIADIIAKKNPKGSEAIVFLDEIDKTLIPDLASLIAADYQKMLIYDLLNMIDGSEYPLKRGYRTIDTNRTLFIGLGAFDEIRKRKSKKESEHTVNHIGFIPEKCTTKHHIHSDADITREDLFDAGISAQFIGRFGTIVNFHEINKSVFKKLITKICDEYAKQYLITLEATDKAVNEYYKMLSSPYGVRGIKHSINDAIAYTLMDLSYRGESTEFYDFVLAGVGKLETVTKAFYANQEYC
jgi:ATP-dependent protease Clp ATPase subunit